MTISSPAVALAGGKIASALMDFLVEKGVLSKEDARSVLTKALNSDPLADVDNVNANRIIASMLSGKYSARNYLK
jgi:polyhydroxyalkanoate synthesis regulator phasin